MSRTGLAPINVQLRCHQTWACVLLLPRRVSAPSPLPWCLCACECVVLSASLAITSFALAMVPPPMSGGSVPLPGTPVDVCFEPVCDGGDGESHVVVRTSSGGVYIVAVRVVLWVRVDVCVACPHACPRSARCGAVCVGCRVHV